MTYEYTRKLDNGTFRFELSGGFFGNKDIIKVYKDGSKVDEIELSDSDANLLQERKSQGFFQNICMMWYGDYDCDL